MPDVGRYKRRLASALLPPATAALAGAIFVADTVTKVDIPVAVLYVIVVLVAARFLRARGVVLVGLGCAALTILSFLASSRGSQLDGVTDGLISLTAVAITTALTVQGQATESRLREQANLLDLTHDSIFVRDLHDVITYWNRGAEELYGWPRAEALGRVTHELMRTVFPAPLAEINADLLAAGRWEGVLTHTKRDGAQVVVASRWSLQKDKQGRPAMILETNNDISERTRAEERLRQSEEQWKAVFENNPTMFFIVDGDGAIVSVNPFGAEQLGYTAEELVGRPVATLFYAADREAASSHTADCLERPGQAKSWELRKVRKDGEVVWVRETARAMPIKGRLVVLVVCEDISERKQAEHLTEHVFDSSPDAICIIGRDYRYQRVNRVYERIFRMPVDEIAGKHVVDLLGQSVFQEISKPCLDRCFAGEDVTGSSWIEGPRGRVYLSVSYTPLRPRSERVEAALVISRDLTAHVQASEALRAAQAELAHVNRVATMGQLTASIAHEVNQPIAAAVINAQAALRWLAARPPDLEEVRQALERILSAGARAGEVLGRIRALIKKAPPNKGPFDLNAALRDVLALTRSEALKHGVTVQTQLAADLPPVEGDRVQLQQVMLNLVMNAIEAMSGAEGPRELQLATETDPAGHVRLAVRDSGPGLDPQAAPRLFDAFYTTKTEGLGMGLAISRSIVEAHGGQLWAGANEPRGAVFQLTLPSEPAGAGSRPAAGLGPPASG